YGASQPRSNQSTNAQLLEDQVTLSLGQLGRVSMQEVVTNVSDPPMHARSALPRTVAVTRTSLLPTERAALLAKLRQQLPERTRAVDALELASFAIGDDGKGTKPAIDAHRTCLRPARPALGMQGRGLYVQAHAPVSSL